MARKNGTAAKKQANGANLGFEATLWAAADKLRGHMDASDYKHVVLGLIFLKYVSDAFEEKYEQLQLDFADPNSAYYIKEPAARYDAVEDRDDYTAENVFWVPKEARWSFLRENARQPTIRKLVDDAMAAIERENPSLKGMLPKDYGRPSLDKQRLGELIDLLSSIGLGGKAARSKDILGRVYEYFLGQFAGAEGKRGGEFYTPRCVVRLLVEMLEPYRGRVYDPCCGSSGMFVQSEAFIEAHGGRRGDIAIYGQESNPATWRMARMNLVLRGIEADLGPRNADTFHEDLHPDLKADFILANPAFNISDWGGERLRDDVRWKHGAPPVGNANFAWVQHILHHLAPNGCAGFVLANGSLSSNTGGEGAIRASLVEADLVDCIVALPPQLFYGTPIPACLWFLARNKGAAPRLNVGAGLAPPGTPDRAGQAPPLRDRRSETLFIDCRKMGELVDRTHRELTNDEVRRIADTYHAWRGEGEAPPAPQFWGEQAPPAPNNGGATAPTASNDRGAAAPPAPNNGGALECGYRDVPGFCKSASLAEIREHGHVLTPGRYVGAAEVEDDDEPFAEKMQRLVARLEEQFAESHRLEAEIRANLFAIGSQYTTDATVPEGHTNAR